MMAATHFDNWIFLLLVAVAMLFRWLTSVASKANKSGDTNERSTSSPRPIPRPPAQTDEERIRKFLEALGQPAGTKPPPPVTPRQMDAQRAADEARHRLSQAKQAAEQKKKMFVPHQPLPPLTTFPPPLPIESRAEPAPMATEETPPRVRSTIPESTVYEVQKTPDRESRPPIQAAPAASTNIIALLKSPAGLRNAILLREILGPPRSLQPLELLL